MSTASMTLTDIFPNTRLRVGCFATLRGALCEEDLMNFGGAESTGSPNNDIPVLVVPLEDGPWTNAESLAYLGGD